MTEDIRAAANRVMGWLTRAQHEGKGGVAAWSDAKGWAAPYPEVTGYLIPTFFKWQESLMARTAADWLLTVQREDGAFLDMSGVPKLFDTGAVVEGLTAAHAVFGDRKYHDAAMKAKRWAATQPSHCSADLPPYHARSDAFLVGPGRKGLKAWSEWPQYWHGPVRSHYLMYWVEGVYRMGGDPACIFSSLAITMGKPLDSEYEGGWVATGVSKDLCATAQLAWLLGLLGLPLASDMVLTVAEHVQSDGGIPLDPKRPAKNFSWCAKYFLDAAFEVLNG